jgi:hypothetical protein
MRLRRVRQIPIWSANMQQFYIDTPDQPYYIATTSNLSSGDNWPFNAQLFLITNLGVGGTPSSSTSNPAIMTFDYVRQYQAGLCLLLRWELLLRSP